MKPYIPQKAKREIKILEEKEKDNKAVGMNPNQTMKERGYKYERVL